MKTITIICLIITNVLTLFHFKYQTHLSSNKIDRLLELQDTTSQNIGRLNYKYSVYIWAEKNKIPIDFNAIDSISNN